MKYYAIAHNGSMKMNDYTRGLFIEMLKENEGARLEIIKLTPESDNMRAYFEGAIVPFITFHQEGMNHRNSKDCRKVREWMKDEFNGETVIVAGKAKRVTASTVGRLKYFIEKCMDWMGEQGYKIELLNPDDYKRWKEEIFPIGEPEDPDNYIDYLVSIGKL